MSRRAERQSGFSVVELIVAAFLVVIVTLGFLGAFDSASRINRTEAEVSDLQGSLRYAAYQLTRNIRMAGDGFLPIEQSVLARNAATGDCYDNVGVGPCPAATFLDLNGKSHPVQSGTDLLQIRGVISTPLFAMGAPGGCSDGKCQGAATTVTVPGATNLGIDNSTSFGLISQLAPPQLLVVVSAATLYNVGLATSWKTVTVPAPQNQNLQLTVDFTDAFARSLDGIPTPANPMQLEGPIRAGIVDDYIYFIDATEPNHPALSVARRSPAPGVVQYEVSAIASDIEDMQIAYGIDLNADNAIGPPVGAAAGDDEWLGNVDGEAPPTVAQIQGTPPATGLHAVMISLVAKEENPDLALKGRQASLGVKTMNSRAAPVSATAPYSRRTVTWRINLRNFVYQGV